MSNEKNIEQNALSEEELMATAGGKMIAEGLVYDEKAKKSIKKGKTLYTGENKTAGGLVYKDDDRIDKSQFFDGPTLC